MKSRILILMLTGISLMFFANNCGSKNTPNGSGTTDLGSTDPNVQKVLADCSRASGQSITARAMIAKDNFGNYDGSHLRLKFDSVPNAYNVGSGYDMQLRLWTAAYNADTNTITRHYDDSNSAKMTFEYQTGTTFQYLAIGEAFPLLLNRDEILDIAEHNQLTSINSPAEFFARVVLNIDMKDSEGSYKVLEINIKDSNGQVVNTTSLLIPRFEASPDEYKASHPNMAVLYDLHPLHALLASGFTIAQYFTESQKSCF